MVSTYELATNAQRGYLRDLYRHGLGYIRSLWMSDYLKRNHMTKDEASKEIARLLRIKRESGATAMVPKNWEEIKPNDEELKVFLNQYSSRVRLVQVD